MKLLSTPQGKSQQELTVAQQELRVIELDQLINKKRKELNDLDQQVVTSMSTIGLRNYEQEKEWQARIKILSEEVEGLEARKKRALEPLVARETALNAKEAQFTSLEISMTRKEQELDRERHSIETRLLDIGRREEIADARKKELDALAQSIHQTEDEAVNRLLKTEEEYSGLITKESDLRESASKLITEISSLREERKKVLAPIEELERGLMQREQALAFKEEALSKREKEVRAESELAIRMTEALDSREDHIKVREDYLEDLEYRIKEQEKAAQKRANKALMAVKRAEDKLQQEKNAFIEESVALKEQKQKQDAFTKEVIVPLEKREKEVHTNEEALSKRAELISIKETDLQQTADILQDRLDEVSERESNALNHAQRLESRNANIALKEEEMQKRETALVEIFKENEQKRLLSEQSIAKQQAILKGRDTVLIERVRIVSKKEKSFESREKAITDRYKTLERAIAEMKLKYGEKLILKD